LLRSSKDADQEALVVFHFGAEEAPVNLRIPSGVWRKDLDSADSKWLGAGGAVPLEVRSDGAVSLRMAGKSVCVLTRVPS
jgi:hypothetical protein